METFRNKVIIINGSPKANGNTATALHEVERVLEQQGIETEWIHVGHLQIHGCIACNKCWESGTCAFGDIVNEISKKMLEADGLLIGSPVYFASPNGTLLSLLDRLFFSNLHTDWSMKVGAAVSIARRGGATATIDVLNKYFLKTNMPVVPSQYWSIAHGTDPGEVTQDEEGMQTMRQLGLNMAFMIKSFKLGIKEFGSPKIQEQLVETHYIR
jgi:multimeric flavodoxin WrbA